MRAPLDRARRDVEAMLAALRLEDREVSLVLCDDRVIHELNRDYRGYDKPTDVLAFALSEAEGFIDVGLLGDIVISLETTARQSVLRRDVPASAALDRELLMLLAHGLLHLLGFDHRDRTEERRMKARTDALMSAAIAARSGKIARDRRANT